MSYTSIYIGVITVVFGITICCFNLSEPPVAKCNAAEAKRDLNTPLVFPFFQQVKVSTPPPKEFHVRGYQGRSINMGVLLPFIDGSLQDYPPEWNKVYARSIDKSTLLVSNKIDDMIEDYPASWIEHYTSVWIKSGLGEEHLSLMSESNELTPEQRSLLKDFDIGTSFEVVVNFQRTNPVTREIIYERLNVTLTVVPEKEAEFPGGYERLIAYFEDNLRQYEGKQPDDLNLMGIKFSIGEDGQAEGIHESRTSGDEEVDRYMVEMVKNMPAWTPAEDAGGKPVKQSFELIYGMPGC